MGAIENNYGISNIRMRKTVHCFCPLGNDWYTGTVEIDFYPTVQIMDYCDVDEFFKVSIEGKPLIVEVVVAKISEMLEGYNPRGYEVSVTAEDAAHLPVMVSRRNGLVNNES